VLLAAALVWPAAVPSARAQMSLEEPALPSGPPVTAAPAEGGWERPSGPRLTLHLEREAVMADEAGDPAAGAGGGAEADPSDAADSPPWCRMPLPAHNLQGVGGGLITPMAYLVSPGPPESNCMPPALSYTFVRLGTKSAHVTAVTQTLYRRIEIGYAFTTLGLGNFPDEVQDTTGVDIGLDHVMVHYFNLRGMLLEETAATPAVTAGATFMYNPNVQTLDDRLLGGCRLLGMERSNGTDFTLTASKTFPELFFGRPVMLSGGIRFSQAAQIGTLGFGDAYRMTGEGSIVAFLTDCLALGYEYRQKKSPLDRMGDCVKPEDDWHTVILAFCISPQCCLAVGWGHFGNLANSDENGVWGFQVKYDF
jgi:hypothetical protein